MSETRDMREPREAREPRDAREPQEAREPQPREMREPREMRNETTTEPIRSDKPMRTNPQAPPMAARQPAQMDIWPDLAEFHRRFDEIQSEFIEDPKSAVKKAEQLMQEIVERVTRTMQERMRAMHRDVDGKDGDTEMLRQTMRSYKQLIESMEGRRAA